MITLKNKATNEIFEMSGAFMEDGKVFNYDLKPFSKRYQNAHAERITNISTDHEGRGVADLCVEWEVVKTTKRPRPRVTKPTTTKPTTETTTATTPTEPTEAPTEEVIPAETEQPTATTTETTTTATTTTTDETETALTLARLIMEMKGTTTDEAQLREMVKQFVQDEMKNHEAPQNVVTVKVGDAVVGSVEKPHPLLEDLIDLVINDRADGRFPWLFGPAGSGKSTLAKQAADALGLPFYSVSSLQQKYELEGYTDAAGEFVQTAFYKAMKNGGVFVFDEASTSPGEVQVAFNTAAAQLFYNFPKEGMITAHKDFHIIAADNTTGRGGNKTYNSRFQMDASTLDRYTFLRVDYTLEHDLNMAGGDKELVAFIREVRKVLDESQSTYLATPRASRAIKAKLDRGQSIEKAVNLGLCSGWDSQDLKTIAARMEDNGNKYTRAFKNIARNC